MHPSQSWKRLLQAFRTDTKGQIAILFAFASAAFLLSIASGIDLTRAYQARQKLSQTAVLACQYASRPSISASSATYVSNVDSYITTSLAAQKFPWTQTNAQPFTYTTNGPANVRLTANVATVFMNVVQVNQVPISASAHCYDTPPTQAANGPVTSETFPTTGCTGSGACGYMYQAVGTKVSTPGGSAGQYGWTLATPNSNANASIGYTGDLSWVIMGYCLEVDTPAVYPNQIPGGYNSVELDCDNGSNTKGNSSMSTKLTLAQGYYELRYFYNSRVKFPDYNPAYICGSTASDLAWANNTNSTYMSNSASTTYPNAPRTNQVNVYLDQASGVPPVHTTIDGTQSLAGANLIDMCVYSANFNWIERSVRIYVNNSGNYWLSFAADGTSDAVGGAIGYIRMCQGTCPGTLQDNFPSAWLSSPNLFEDQFASPVYSYTTSGASAYVNTSGNMTNSLGTSGSGSGWPALAASGWAAAPVNQVDYVMKNVGQGAQGVELDGSTTTQKLISRGFLLDPGYYQVSYRYIADGRFSTAPIGVSCGATPSAAGVNALSGPAPATSLQTSAIATVDLSSNIVGVFMSHGSLASTPNVGGSLNSTTSYNNPDGSTSTIPAVAPNAISLSNYNASQVNALLDICGYATTWQTRTANIRVTKPGYYWLTLSSLGATNATFGGAIDDVKLSALGSPYMASPPSVSVTLQTPGPLPEAITTNTGFEFVNDPLTPPAPTL